MPNTVAKLDRPLSGTAPPQVNVALNPPLVHIVNQLYQSGLYGNSPSQVVHQAFCRGLRALLLEHEEMKSKVAK